MSKARRTRRLVVRGRVQGVGFRYATVRAAQRFGVTGWVRNRSDGSVEAVVYGTVESVEAIVAWARRGPDAAIVENLEVMEAEGEFSTFETRPTE
ncbi:MAG TPA: acylphosphatase [Usitatibacter sp.]|nr:acylphosphatase [Usitatibacter sp.]